MVRKLRLSPNLRGRLDTAKSQDWLKKRFKMQSGKCAYCGVAMVMEPRTSKRSATLDHVIPKSAGGLHHWENTAAACRACNEAKRDLSAEEFARRQSSENGG